MPVKSHWQIFSPAKVAALALVFFITSSLPTFATDATPPTGGAISYSTGPITKSNQSFVITVNDGTDSGGSGINTSSRQLLRSEALYINGTCGTFSNYYPVPYTGTYPNITNTNFNIDKCYKYSWSVSDTAGNTSTYTSSIIITTSSNTISLSKAPIGTVIKVNNLFFVKANTTGLLLSFQPYNYSYSSTFDYTGSPQTFTAPYSGWYQIEAWGAQGGSVTSSYYNATHAGGKGAYSAGKIYLNQGEQLYIQVGGAGISGTQAVIATYDGGYNGGGNGYVNRTSCSQTAASGGGATDIRLSSGDWDNASSLKSRILTAAAGGGAFSEYCGDGDNAAIIGGAGGSLVGGTAIYQSRSGFSTLNPTGGTQTDGGKSLDNWTSTDYSTTYAGSFGTGATGGNSYSGGGGGYYGGASGVWQPGADGSSFISGYAGVNAITSSSLTPTN